jgi:hypothetical protein
MRLLLPLKLCCHIGGMMSCWVHGAMANDSCCATAAREEGIQVCQLRVG